MSDQTDISRCHNKTGEEKVLSYVHRVFHVKTQIYYKKLIDVKNRWHLLIDKLHRQITVEIRMYGIIDAAHRIFSLL